MTLYQVINDLKTYLLILVCIMIGFSTMFYTLFINSSIDASSSSLPTNHAYNGFFNFVFNLIFVRYGMVPGQLDPNFPNDFRIREFSNLLMIVYLVMTIVMSNLLIAIVGDIYDYMKSKESINFLLFRFQAISDIENKMTNKQIKKIKYLSFLM